MTNQDRFTDMQGIEFVQHNNVELLNIRTDFAEAVISLHGATVLSYKPVSQPDLLWVSSEAVYDGEKAIRGGIPVCWPWFGPAKQPGLMAHGFVRNQTWSVESINEIPGGYKEVVLTISDSPESRALWPYPFKLSLSILVGEYLQLKLTTENLSSEFMDITEALHTYFNVVNAEGLQIEGLQLATHIDTLNSERSPEIQVKPVVLNPPRDSVYLDQPGKVVIDDTENHRLIVIEKQHSQSSIVWNPGPEIVKGFADIADSSWREFACVESGNVWDNNVVIPPKETHQLIVHYCIEPK